MLEKTMLRQRLLNKSKIGKNKNCPCGGMVDTARLERVPERGASSSLAMGTICVCNSVGSECHPYKVEATGSNPVRRTKR
jgi:hypothetical protein